jgi:hypothetical protein
MRGYPRVRVLTSQVRIGNIRVLIQSWMAAWRAKGPVASGTSHKEQACSA